MCPSMGLVLSGVALCVGHVGHGIVYALFSMWHCVLVLLGMALHFGHVGHGAF